LRRPHDDGYLGRWDSGAVDDFERHRRALEPSLNRRRSVLGRQLRLHGRRSHDAFKELREDFGVAGEDEVVDRTGIGNAIRTT